MTLTVAKPGLSSRRVVISGRPSEAITQDLMDAIQFSNYPYDLFIYNEQLAVIDSVSGNGGGVKLDMLTLPSLQGWALQRFQCVKPLPKKKDDHSVEPDFAPATLMPKEYAQAILTTKSLWVDIPHLRGITRRPFFRSDGTLVTTPGYDAASHMYYAPPFGFELPYELPDAPDERWTEWALRWLRDEMLADFPFATDADFANCLAMMLSPACAQLTRSAWPLFIISADNPGTGKTLLAKAIAKVLGGMSLMPWVSREEEMEKRITGTLGTSTEPMIVWDNMPEGTTIDSPVLATLHTAETWTGRLLGRSQSVRMANDRIWVATGNQLYTGGDMGRRSVWITLNAPMAHPEDRPASDFKHPSLRDWVDANQGRLMVALLGLVKAWVAKGMPKMTSDEIARMGDYSRWVEVMGGILENAGVEGFLANASSKREEGDVAAQDGDALLSMLRDHFGPAEFRVSDAVVALNKMADPMSGSVETALPAEIARYVDGIGMKAAQLSRKLGSWFSSHEGRYYGGADSIRVMRGEKDPKTKTWTYKIVKDSDKGT